MIKEQKWYSLLQCQVLTWKDVALGSRCYLLSGNAHNIRINSPVLPPCWNRQADWPVPYPTLGWNWLQNRFPLLPGTYPPGLVRPRALLPPAFHCLSPALICLSSSLPTPRTSQTQPPWAGRRPCANQSTWESAQACLIARCGTQGLCWGSHSKCVSYWSIPSQPKSANA